MAILLLRHEGRTITDVHHLTGAARSTIGRWLRWYRDEGIDALKPYRLAVPQSYLSPRLSPYWVLLMQFSPQDFGYQRSRWCTELLAIKINRLTGLNVAASTLRRWFTSYGHCLAQARADLADKRPAYQEKWRISTPRWPAVMPIIPVFYEDEVDIDLNPKLEPTDVQERSKSGLSHRGRMPSGIWQAFSTQATKGTLRQRIKKTHRCLLPCWKSCATTTDEPNHHVDPR